MEKYTWLDVGSSYLPSELVAAYLYGQLECFEVIHERRLHIFSRYREGLAECEAEALLRLPIVPPGCGPNGHLFYALLATAC